MHEDEHDHILSPLFTSLPPKELIIAMYTTSLESRTIEPPPAKPFPITFVAHDDVDVHEEVHVA